MKLLDKLKDKKQKMQEQIQRGREKTEQQRAERLRRKVKKFTDMKPGARKAVTEGLMTRSGPIDVMKKEYSRRKHMREQKYRKKNQ